MYKKILVPIDGSELSARALEQAGTLARQLGAGVTVLTVTPRVAALSVEPFAATAMAEQSQELYGRASRILEEALGALQPFGVAVEATHIQDDDPYKAIIDAARQHGCDLIAMASHGRSGIAAVVLGSVTTKVLTHSKIPVLVYR
ncbi:universal stress protein [Alsobacter soli]|uniref:Universal stress protein n=1 Tax=Alsobacter soli TaxID=2109933 RepID=A0A2T1HUE7_9HYPH|nr:universal stress protein [Alsobacter soli]PSC05277.1 universal stress protein [Alsobacter soli]